HIVTGREATTGRLVFVLPRISRKLTGITVLETTDLGVSDYSAPIVDRTCRVPPGIALQIRQILPDHDILRIRPVREESLPLWAAFLDGGSTRLDFSAHATDLEPVYADW